MKKTLPLFLVVLAILVCRCTNTTKSTVAVNEGQFSSKSELFAQVTPGTDTFMISTVKDTVLICKKGTKIFLPANALEDESGKAISQAEITVKECYSSMDMFAEKLSTAHDSCLLETGGMVKITAQANGKDLKLKQGRNYSIALPKKVKGNDSMSTFYGKQSDNGSMNWITANEMSNKAATEEIATENTASFNEDAMTDSSYYSFKPTVNYYTAWFRTWKIKNSNLTVIDYADKNFRCPDNLIPRIKKMNSVGGSLIQFSLNEKGAISGCKISRSFDLVFDSLCLGFVKSMPNIEVNQDTFKKFTHTDYVLGFDLRYSYNVPKMKARLEKKYGDLKTVAIKKMDVTEVDFFVLTVTDFGWINCDRFYGSPEQKIEFVVKADAQSAQLVFTDIRAIMQGELKDGSFVFHNVPVGQKVKLVSIQFKNEQPLLSTAETVIKDAPFAMSDYKPFTLNELQVALGGVEKK